VVVPHSPDREAGRQAIVHHNGYKGGLHCRQAGRQAIVHHMDTRLG